MRNDQSTAAYWVRVIGTLYDGAGYAVGCGSVSPADYSLDAGQASSFNLGYSFRDYGSVVSYRLQGDGTVAASAVGVGPARLRALRLDGALPPAAAPRRTR